MPQAMFFQELSAAAQYLAVASKHSPDVAFALILKTDSNNFVVIDTSQPEPETPVYDEKEAQIILGGNWLMVDTILKALIVGWASD